ncbi:MAG TPA: ABC transporter permease [Anaerolineales bacterium]|nr:ABC transporter permease [Anaerolineales bacterium]
MTLRYVLSKLIKNPTAVIGLVLLLGFIILAVGAPQFAPVPENSRDPFMIPRDGFRSEPQGPSEDHIMGTTEGQYDIWYGVVWGSRTAFRIGIVITLFTTLIGVLIGSISAYFGGWIDEVLMRITEIFQAFPFLLTAITLTSVLQAVYGRGDQGFTIWTAKILAFLTFGHSLFEDINPIQLSIITGMIAIIIFGWMTIARVTRGNILAVKNFEYALAARTIGARDSRILFRHLLPNAIFPVLVIASMNIGSYVLTFAALSFLGLGAQVGYADWGQMISFARNWISSLADYSHIIMYPGTVILLFVLSWNLVGDALRDILDPRLRGSN